MRKYLLLLLLLTPILLQALLNIVSFQKKLSPSDMISFKDSLKTKDSCSLEDAFDQRKFDSFFAIDTILDTSFNTKLFEKRELGIIFTSNLGNIQRVCRDKIDMQ